MKKKKILTVIFIVQCVMLIGAIVGSVFLWPHIWRFEDLDNNPNTVIFGTETDVYSGYADVTLYGAIADDNKDDTDAFIEAAKTGAGVYVPFGIFDIDETITLRGQNLKGCGIDRTIIRFNGKGTIVELKGAAMIDDITLSFADGFISGNETIGEQVAICDKGITTGTVLKSVKLTNVGTGYYSVNSGNTFSSLTIESLFVDKFSYKAVLINDAVATILRSVQIGEPINNVDTAISLGGTFTAEALVFNGTKCNFPIELNNCKSAVISSVIFDSVEPVSDYFVKSISSVISMRTVTVKSSKATALVKIDDTAEGGETIGNVISLWSDSGVLLMDDKNIIRCESNVSQ